MESRNSHLGRETNKALFERSKHVLRTYNISLKTQHLKLATRMKRERARIRKTAQRRIIAYFQLKFISFF